MYKNAKGQNKKLEQATGDAPPSSFYDLSIVLNNNNGFQLENLKGKKVLIVNTASNCGYTNQYSQLQELHEKHKEKLVILAFPSNDFKEQEKGSDEEIAQFCEINYGVTFPLIKKSSVIKGKNQNGVYQWLSNKNDNGWNDQQPTWNFTKYLVNEEGVLTNYFAPFISPLSKDVITAINAE